MPDDPQVPFDVFLSHAHVDAGVVEILGARLVDEASLRVWLDRWVLIPGGHWQQEMARGLEQARTSAVCIGRSTPNGWFREEIEKALNRQTKDTSFRVIPVILPDGDSSVIDNFLDLRTWVDFRSGIADVHAFHLLKSGVIGVPPGRLQVLSSQSDEVAVIRDRLSRIRALRIEQLIDDDIALEYQRRILDQLITGGRGR
jgi:TIR domain